MNILKAGEILKAKGLLFGEVTKTSALEALKGFVASQSKMFVDAEHHALEVIASFGGKTKKLEVKKQEKPSPPVAQPRVEPKPEVQAVKQEPEAAKSEAKPEVKVIAQPDAKPQVKVIATAPPKKELGETVEN